MARGKVFTNRKQKIAVEKDKVKKLAKAKKKSEKKKSSKGSKEDKTHPAGGGDYFDPKTGVVFSTRPEDSCIPLMEANITKFLKDQGELENPQDHVTVALHVIDYLSGDQSQLTQPPPIPSEMSSNEEVTISFWQEVKDSKSGHIYYWNPTTNQVSWTLPENAVLTSEASERSDEIQDPENESPTREVVPSASISSQGSDSSAKEGEPLSSSSLADVSQDDDKKRKKKVSKSNGSSTNGKSNKSSKESLKLRLQVSNMADEISRKLNYLHVDTENTSELQLLNIRLQARLEDWKEGELSSKFVLTKLKEADEAIQAFVQKEVPMEWTCVWDRGTCRYYFKHSITEEITWEFPTVATQGCSPQSSPQQETADSVQDEASSDDDIDNEIEKVIVEKKSTFVGPPPPVAPPPPIEASDKMQPGSSSEAPLPKHSEPEEVHEEQDMDLDSESESIPDKDEPPNMVDSLYSSDLPPPADDEDQEDDNGAPPPIDDMVLSELEAANQEAMLMLENMKNNDMSMAGWKPVDSSKYTHTISATDEDTIKDDVPEDKVEQPTTNNPPTQQIEEVELKGMEQQPTEEELAIAITGSSNVDKEQVLAEEKDNIDKETEKRSRDGSVERNKSSSKKSRRGYRDDNRSDSDYSDDRRRSRRRRSSRDGRHRHSRKSRKYSDDSDDGHTSRRRGNHRRSRSKDRRDKKKKDRKKRHHRDSSSEDEKETKRRHEESSSDEEYPTITGSAVNEQTNTEKDESISASSLPPLEKSFVPARFKPKGKAREGSDDGTSLSQTQVEMIHNIATATGAYPMVWDPAQYAAAYYPQTMYDPNAAAYMTASTTNDVSASNETHLIDSQSANQCNNNSIGADNSEMDVASNDTKSQEDTATVYEQDNQKETPSDSSLDKPVSNDEQIKADIEEKTEPTSNDKEATKDDEGKNEEDKSSTKEPTTRDSTPPLQETTTTTASSSSSVHTISAPSTSYQYTTDPQAYAAYAMAYNPYYAQLSGVYDQGQYAAAMNYYAAYQAAYTGAYGAYYQQAAAQQQQSSSSTPVSKK